MRFRTYYDGIPILFLNTDFDRDDIIQQLQNSEIGEVSIGYYRFILIE